MGIKSLLKAGVLVLFVSASTVFGEIINFDDLVATPAGGNHDAIPNGYGGLNWGNFNVIDGVNSDSSTGYHYAPTSGNNVAFNNFGDLASVNGSAFNLTSGYFTSAWNDNLQLEVKGFVGSTLAYDHTYTLSAVAPTFINLNLQDVSQVQFVSSGGTQHAGYGGSGTQFAMDDLTVNFVNAPETGSTCMMLGAALTGLVLLRKSLPKSAPTV